MTEPKTKRIDWAEVKKRLEKSQVAPEKAGAVASERVEEIYRERAGQLAARRTQASAPVSSLRILVFSLGTEHYALEFADLIEILAFTTCAPVPGGPPELLGVVNIRGEIRSLLDLGRLLALPSEDRSSSGYLVRIRNQGREAVLRVDGVEYSQLLAREDLSSLGDGDASESARYVKGLTSNKVRLLSTEALLRHPVFKRTRNDEG